MERRSFILGGSFGLATFAFGVVPPVRLDPTITVYKAATCSCCNGWIEHLKSNGFKVTVQEVTDSKLRKLKKKHSIPPALQT